MIITTLGTSHGDATATRYQSSTLIEVANRYYLVDAGEPASASLIRNGVIPAALSAVFITHMHYDHTGGLPVVIGQAHKYRRRYPDIQTKYLLPDATAIPALVNWLAANQHHVPEPGICSYAPGIIYSDELLTVEAFPNRHLTWSTGNAALNSCGLRLNAEGKRVFFTGDLVNDFSDFPADAADGCDLLCSELTHFPLEAALPALKKIRVGKLLFLHLGNPWQTPEGQAKALELCRDLPYPTALAYDNLKITP